MFRTLYIFLLATVFPVLILAQTNKMQVSAYAGSGMSSVNSTPNIGASSGGTGIHMGADFRYFFKPNMAISVGLNVASYNGKYSIGNDSLKVTTIDSEGEQFEFKSYFKNWEESQSIMTFGVPIMYLYEYPLNNKISLMGGAGVKVGFVMASDQKQTAGEVTTVGYYPSLGYPFVDLPQHGFSTYTFTQSQGIKSSVNLSFIVDVLANYKINPVWSVFGGLFLDYGISNLASSNEDGVLSYVSTNPASIKYNGALNSNAVSNAHTMAVGAKVGVTFDLRRFIDDRNVKAAERARIAAEDASMRSSISSKMKIDILEQAAILNKQMKEKQAADSIQKAEIRAKELHDKAIADSIINQERIKQLNDSINILRIGGEGKVIMVIRTKELNAEEVSLLQLPIDFERGQADITPQYKDNARKIGEILAKHSTLRIGITGHTCDLGPEDVNYKLGLQRANTLLEAFVMAGTDRNQISTASKGELEPMVPNTNEENRQKNRRVVIVIEDDISQ